MNTIFYRKKTRIHVGIIYNRPMDGMGYYGYAHCFVLQVVLVWVFGYLNTFEDFYEGLWSTRDGNNTQRFFVIMDPWMSWYTWIIPGRT